MINESVKAIIEPLLEPGEKLLWADRPAKRFDPPILAGITIAAGLLIFVFPEVIGEIFATWQDVSYGILFLTALLALAALWMIRAAILPGYESFALTNERVIVRKDLFPRQSASIPITALDKVKVNKAGRFGSIHLFMGQAGLSKKTRFEGSFGIRFPFLTAQGFILNNVQDAESFLKHLNKLYPQAGAG